MRLTICIPTYNRANHLADCLNSLIICKKNTRYDFNNFVKILKKNKKKVGVYKISEKRWRDVGTWEEYKKSVSLMK